MYMQFTIVNGAHGYSCKYVLNEIVQYIQANMPHKHITFLTHVCALCGLFRKDFDCKLQTYKSWFWRVSCLFICWHSCCWTDVSTNQPPASFPLSPSPTTNYFTTTLFHVYFYFHFEKKIFSFTFALNAPSHSTTVQFRLICLHPTSFQQLPLFSFSGPDNFGRWDGRTDRSSG